MVVGAADRAIAEDLGLGISDAEVTCDGGGGLFEVEGVQMAKNGDALAKGFEGGEKGACGRGRDGRRE